MASPVSPPAITRFGPFELDAAERELRKSGVLLKIHPQPLRVLLLLAQNPGKTVTREEIQQCLWGNNTHVDFERGINFCVNQIRATLGDDPDKPRYVETLPRRGYRFIAPVKSDNGFTTTPTKAHDPEQPAEPALCAEPLPAKQQDSALSMSRAAHARKRWYLLAALGLVMVVAAVFWRSRQPSVPPLRSLAVLPLENLSGDPAQDYFADGMTDALITELGKISALRVISRQSMMQYKDTKKSIPQIARDLNVEAVVEGSVVRAGDRVRISVQLIEAAPERHLWANSYDRRVGDVLALHGEMARTVAREIRITLAPGEETRMTNARGVTSQANEAYFRGRYFLEGKTKDDFDKARADFQETIQLEPTFAPAYASLAEVYLALGGYDAAQRVELLKKAQTASLKALELDESLSAAHYTLAAYRAHVWDWTGAESEYRRAIELNPSNATAHMWYASLLIGLDRMSEAEGELHMAETLDPLSLEKYGAATLFFYYARRYDELIKNCRAWVEKNRRLEWNYHHCVGAAYVQMGRNQEAVAELQEALKSSTMYEHTATELANALAVAGEREEALKTLDLVTDAPWRMFGAALVYTALGERDEALRSLDQAIDLRAPLVSLLKPDPRFDSLHHDPRFNKLLSRMNLPQ
jgi:TolB-like protein/DNA-binding winged helix-turn-helix (wHTH) protein/tetratricopeptide (TPR) repeat protein